MKFTIRLAYLYLFSFVGLLIAVIGTIQLLNLFMKVYVFKGADQYMSYADPRIDEDISEEERIRFEEKENQRLEEETSRSRKREASNAIAMIIVSVPLYLYHWRTLSKEQRGTST